MKGFTIFFSAYFASTLYVARAADDVISMIEGLREGLRLNLVLEGPGPDERDDTPSLLRRADVGGITARRADAGGYTAPPPSPQGRESAFSLVRRVSPGSKKTDIGFAAPEPALPAGKMGHLVGDDEGVVSPVFTVSATASPALKSPNPAISAGLVLELKDGVNELDLDTNELTSRNSSDGPRRTSSLNSGSLNSGTRLRRTTSQNSDTRRRRRRGETDSDEDSDDATKRAPKKKFRGGRRSA